MKKIKISNIGPLSNVNILLSRINLLIGPQSSGKSCILKIASFCAWTEKSIELNQSEKPFLSKDAINRNLVDFHIHLEMISMNLNGKRVDGIISAAK